MRDASAQRVIARRVIGKLLNFAGVDFEHDRRFGVVMADAPGECAACGGNLWRVQAPRYMPVSIVICAQCEAINLEPDAEDA